MNTQNPRTIPNSYHCVFIEKEFYRACYMQRKAKNDNTGCYSAVKKIISKFIESNISYQDIFLFSRNLSEHGEIDQIDRRNISNSAFTAMATQIDYAIAKKFCKLSKCYLFDCYTITCEFDIQDCLEQALEIVENSRSPEESNMFIGFESNIYWEVVHPTTSSSWEFKCQGNTLKIKIDPLDVSFDSELFCDLLVNYIQTIRINNHITNKYITPFEKTILEWHNSYMTPENIRIEPSSMINRLAALEIYDTISEKSITVNEATSNLIRYIKEYFGESLSEDSLKKRYRETKKIIERYEPESIFFAD